jgi:hypothetical protein
VQKRSSDVGERIEDLQDRVAAAPAAVRSRVSRATTGIRARLGNLQVRCSLLACEILQTATKHGLVLLDVKAAMAFLCDADTMLNAS